MPVPAAFTIFCKPDVRGGVHTQTRADRARAFLLGLAAMCRGGRSLEGVPRAYVAAASNAARQARERATTEPTFVGEPIHPESLSAQLATEADAFCGSETVATSIVLQAAIRGLGFTVVASRIHVCNEADVDGIYSATTTTSSYSSVRDQLLDYLVGHELLIWWLEGEQPAALLEWWKTFARHVLIDRDPDEHLLVNLVHVCGEEDARYLQRLRPSIQGPNS